ncbi:MAG: DUF2232 domain-containing protein [Gammaproteobacteria bacterium]
MRKLASYILSGRLQAIIVVAGFGVLGLIFPPLVLLSGAALGLVALRLGPAHGGIILALSGITLAVITWPIVGGPMVGIVCALFLWLPIFTLSLVLRQTVSLGFCLQVCAAAGLMTVLGVHLFVPDASGKWRAMLEAVVLPAMERAQMAPEVTERMVAALTIGHFMGSMVLTLIFMLFIARWWQAMLFHPGGFREEFTQLRLGQMAALLVLVVMAAAMLTRSSVAMELVIVALSAFFLQGLAVAHHLSGKARNPKMWLIGLYGLLFVVLPSWVLVGVAGIVDSFADFRARFDKPQQNNG